MTIAEAVVINATAETRCWSRLAGKGDLFNTHYNQYATQNERQPAQRRLLSGRTQSCPGKKKETRRVCIFLGSVHLPRSESAARSLHLAPSRAHIPYRECPNHRQHVGLPQEPACQATRTAGFVHSGHE